MFVPKKDGTRRLCMDYRRLNSMTKLNKHPLPLIGEMFERVRGAKKFTTLDLYRAYNLLRMRRGDEWKTAFRTWYGHFEWLVMPFGLANAPAAFQAFISEILADLLDQGVLVYLDDILIYAESDEEHDRLVHEVLCWLKENKLFCKISKCVFGAEWVHWLGHRISADGIKMDPGKVKSIESWPVPTSVKELQKFLGFANYYRTFINTFGKQA